MIIHISFVSNLNNFKGGPFADGNDNNVNAQNINELKHNQSVPSSITRTSNEDLPTFSQFYSGQISHKSEGFIRDRNCFVNKNENNDDDDDNRYCDDGLEDILINCATAYNQNNVSSSP
eukprot:499196_1